MKRARARAYILDLRPVLAIPYPGVAEKCAGQRVAAKQHDALTRPIERHRMPCSGSRTDVLLLHPQHFCHIYPRVKAVLYPEANRGLAAASINARYGFLPIIARC